MFRHGLAFANFSVEFTLFGLWSETGLEHAGGKVPGGEAGICRTKNVSGRFGYTVDPRDRCPGSRTEEGHLQHTDGCCIRRTERDHA